jgi:hypothetical protein
MPTISDYAPQKASPIARAPDAAVMRRQAWIALATGLVAAAALHGLWASKDLPSPRARLAPQTGASAATASPIEGTRGSRVATRI